MREQLEGKVNHLTQLLQEALRKQDEMALEAADAWQKVRKILGGKKNFQICLAVWPVTLVTVVPLCCQFEGDKSLLTTLLSHHQARENRAEKEALQELLMSREKESQTLTSRLAESQDAVCQLKQLVENHVASEREKNKRVGPFVDFYTSVATVRHAVVLSSIVEQICFVLTHQMFLFPPLRLTTCHGKSGS